MEVASDIRTIFNTPDRKTAQDYLQRAVNKYTQSAPRLATWIENNLDEGLKVIDFPVEHRRMIRTINALERVNREIRRRTRVISIFPNAESCLRLVSALLMEVSEEWQVGKHNCAEENKKSK